MSNVSRTLRATALVSAALFSISFAAAAAEVSGTAKSFECGDNCYLTIKPEGGKALTGLCTAKASRPWNEKAEMPKRLIGKRVTVTLGKGQQLDDDGKVAGDFPAFTKVVFSD